MRSTNPMSERLVSIRRKRSSAGSSRRRDRRPRRSAWYFPSTEGSSLMRLYSKRAVATRSRLSSLCTRSSNALEDAPREIRPRSEEHTSELQSPCNLVCRLLLEKKKKKQITYAHDTVNIHT